MNFRRDELFVDTRLPRYVHLPSIGYPIERNFRQAGIDIVPGSPVGLVLLLAGTSPSTTESSLRHVPNSLTRDTAKILTRSNGQMVKS